MPIQMGLSLAGTLAHQASRAGLAFSTKTLSEPSLSPTMESLQAAEVVVVVRHMDSHGRTLAPLMVGKAGEFTNQTIRFASKALLAQARYTLKPKPLFFPLVMAVMPAVTALLP